MGGRARELSERLRQFNDDIIAFVEKCTDVDWLKECTVEQWPVGVTARHIGAGHYSVVAVAGMMIAGEKLPELTMETIVDMANQHAREHAGCTKQEVLDVLAKGGVEMTAFVAGLQDSDLDCRRHFAVMGREITVEEFLENVVLRSAGDHFANMKAAVGK